MEMKISLILQGQVYAKEKVIAIKSGIVQKETNFPKKKKKKKKNPQIVTKERKLTVDIKSPRKKIAKSSNEIYRRT